MDNYMQKNETGSLYYIYTKIILKWIKVLTVRSETIKLLDEDVGGKLLDISLCDVFLDLTQRARAKKQK